MPGKHKQGACRININFEQLQNLVVEYAFTLKIIIEKKERKKERKKIHNKYECLINIQNLGTNLRKKYKGKRVK